MQYFGSVFFTLIIIDRHHQRQNQYRKIWQHPWRTKQNTGKQQGDILRAKVPKSYNYRISK